MNSLKESSSSRQVWSLILAGGEGVRMHERTCDDDGVVVPKQFFPLLRGGDTLLEQTLQRGAKLVPVEQTIVIVSEHHLSHWRHLRQNHPRLHWLAQPASRGTGVATLLGLLYILHRSPDAVVLLTPADHGVRQLDLWQAALARAIWLAGLGGVALVGVPGRTLDDGFGWVVPTQPLQQGIAPVDIFVEKPDARTAAQLRANGALVSTCVLVGRVADLVDLFDAAVPWLLNLLAEEMPSRNGWPTPQGARLLLQLPQVDLSADVLSVVPQRLLALSAGDCGWADLGTPQRLDDHMRQTAKPHAPTAVKPAANTSLRISEASSAHSAS